MDAVLALKFVKENIRFFGGDPNKVTIFGQSSGGLMVSALVISPNVPRNLFQQAIVQSGTIFCNWAYTTDPIADARTLAKAAGINPNQSIDALNQALIKLNIFDLFNAIEKVEVCVKSAIVELFNQFEFSTNLFKKNFYFSQFNEEKHSLRREGKHLKLWK